MNTIHYKYDTTQKHYCTSETDPFSYISSGAETATFTQVEFTTDFMILGLIFGHRKFAAYIVTFGTSESATDLLILWCPGSDQIWLRLRLSISYRSSPRIPQGTRKCAFERKSDGHRNQYRFDRSGWYRHVSTSGGVGVVESVQYYLIPPPPRLGVRAASGTALEFRTQPGVHVERTAIDVNICSQISHVAPIVRVRVGVTAVAGLNRDTQSDELPRAEDGSRSRGKDHMHMQLSCATHAATDWTLMRHSRIFTSSMRRRLQMREFVAGRVWRGVLDGDLIEARRVPRSFSGADEQLHDFSQQTGRVGTTSRTSDSSGRGRSARTASSDRRHQELFSAYPEYLQYLDYLQYLE
ncbi:hypothetical protein GGX14DRAFT_407680 [Mycena pura]|uniref:Uncharacterized protein n=1 Tax=Mycena pura TaxID=153505 RepID=A0AAD6UN18_9AGAR|nr:hypothetical protein GGX14DRAFT_407680 [Mycena pura]